MTRVTAAMVKDLREKTGLGMNKCKEALEAAAGNEQLAIENLRKAGLTAGAKRAGNDAKEGMILIVEDDHSVVLVEGNSETDFVANNEAFKHFFKEVAEQALKTKPASVQELLAQPFIHDSSITVDQARHLTISKLQENIQIRRIEVLAKTPNTSYGIYIHGPKLGVVVVLEGSDQHKSVARDVAMHVAAINPEYLDGSQIPAEVLEKEKEIARAQMVGKPENMIEKIVAGKMKAREAEICLLNQKYIKNPDVTVQQYVESVAKGLSVRSFRRWQVGQS